MLKMVVAGVRDCGGGRRCMVDGGGCIRGEWFVVLLMVQRLVDGDDGDN